MLLQKPVLTGRYAKWMLLLSELDIIVEKPKAIKSQALVNLLKYSKQQVQEEEILLANQEMENWILYFDGASSRNQGSVGIVLSNEQGEIFKKAVKLDFPCSNNQAEYEALVIGLDLAKEMEIPNLEVRGDSNLIIKQISGDFAVKEPSLIKYRDEVQKILRNFESYELRFVPRSQNKYADALATLVLKMGPIEEDLILIPLEVKMELAAVTEQEEADWVQGIKQKLENPKLGDLQGLKAFMLLQGHLYKKKKVGNGMLANA